MKTLKKRKRSALLNRKKKDPAKFLFTGSSIEQGLEMQLFKYNKGNFKEVENISLDNLKSFDSDAHVYWLNIYGLSDTEAIVQICRKYGIHDLTIQDILDVNQRSKFQEFEKFSFLAIKSFLPNSDQVVTEQISFVYGSNFLISFQEKKADHFNHLRERIREDVGLLRERSSDYLLYSLLEAILDSYFKTIDQIDREVDEFSSAILDKDIPPTVLKIIEEQKKMVHFIKKSILPIRDFALGLEQGHNNFVQERHLKYFFEIKDLCLNLLDSCEFILNTLESSSNLFFSVQGHRMNEVMKTLTIVATIFIPLTFIAGVYGMNFHNMPELSWRYGYLAIWIVMFLLLVAMVLYFKKKRWF
ncbi:MAG: magnesium/cobalt transporter CorA [Bacteroidales bacterium]|nr:magnesium/cobalt transporter CorA [Bacteroidales bacterium]